MNRLPALALVLVSSVGCAELTRLQAPADVRCGPSLVEISGFADSGPVDVLSTQLDGAAAEVVVRDERGAELALHFTIDPTAPPQLPPQGPAVLRVEQDTCLGEGCSEAYWIVRDVDDTFSYFEIGHVTAINEGPSIPRLESLTLRSDPSGLTCGDDDDELGAVAVLATDDGDLDVLPGATDDIVLDGQPWKVLAGETSRHAFVQSDGPCADCPGPGLWLTYRAEAVLYPLPVDDD